MCICQSKAKSRRIAGSGEIGYGEDWKCPYRVHVLVETLLNRLVLLGVLSHDVNVVKHAVCLVTQLDFITRGACYAIGISICMKINGLGKTQRFQSYTLTKRKVVVLKG